MNKISSNSLIVSLIFCIFLCSLTYEISSELISKNLRSSSQTILNETSLDPVHPEALLPFFEYCTYFNYPVERHRIIVDDGYILTLFRIQRKYSSITSNLPVVLMQHGLLDSSDGSIINDESKAPGFMLANKGYDVWLSNVRGNKYSRSHVQYNPDKDKEFWEFSFDEMAERDLPAFFQYVTNYTGQDLIDYVGHSQGTTIMFAALSEKNPIILQHLKKFIALGPVAYVYHQNSKAFDLMKNSNLVGLLDWLEVYEFSPANWLQEEVGSIICAYIGNVCADLLAVFSDEDASRDNAERYDVVQGHFPSGTSVKNMKHWQQSTEVNEFRKFDYGTEENLKRYGLLTPPKYELENIEHEVYLFAGEEDLLSNPIDVLRLKYALKNAHLKTYEKMGHLTFVVGTDMSFMDDVILALEKN